MCRSANSELSKITTTYLRNPNSEEANKQIYFIYKFFSEPSLSRYLYFTTGRHEQVVQKEFVLRTNINSTFYIDISINMQIDYVRKGYNGNKITYIPNIGD
ncbi:hypothetical protein RhiirC2_857247 [Rhizophagus irregularis]|uniref:Uncharacterized protein n=1 Tax=Rhizophagus irregularis TaxID=588596 RepID=A0A2N1MDE8_9GLOM|nr:hypothetical protein RhiirC2_857247 [Rhizophagus irregularis]